MTNQHRATPEQWASLRETSTGSLSSCLIELRARVEALEELHKAVADLSKRFSLDPLVDRVEELEGRYETQRQATLAWGKDLDNHGRWIDDHLKRIMALESTTPAPADSLVERVARAIRAERAFFDKPADWADEARAAIREVAAALIDWHDSDQVVRTAWEAAKWLEREAIP